MMQAGHIVGKVEYREGDGPTLEVRKGPVDVETTAIDATLSWTEGDDRGSAASPLADYNRYVNEGAIRVVH